MSDLNLEPFPILEALGIDDALAATPVSGGMDTRIWQVQRPDGCYALRVLHPGQESRCRREVAAMHLAVEQGMPAPAVHAVGVWEEHPVLLISWLSGTTLADAVLSQPDCAGPLGVIWGRALARLHSTPVSELDLEGDWIAACGPQAAHIEALLRREAQGSALLHLDYHPLNVLIEGEQITGVVDWANSCIGDPRADVARSCILLRLILGRRDVLGIASTLPLRRLERGLLQGYQEVAGPLRAMPIFLAWAWAATAVDQTPRAHSGGWLQPRHIESMHRRAAAHYRISRK